MNWLGLAIALIDLMAAVVNWAQQQKWYQQGVNDGIAEQRAADDAARAALQKRYADIAAADMSASSASGFLHNLAGDGAGNVPDTPSAS